MIEFKFFLKKRKENESEGNLAVRMVWEVSSTTNESGTTHLIIGATLCNSGLMVTFIAVNVVVGGGPR